MKKRQHYITSIVSHTNFSTYHFIIPFIPIIHFIGGIKKETIKKYRLLLVFLNIYDNTPSIVPHLRSMSMANPRIQ